MPEEGVALPAVNEVIPPPVIPSLSTEPKMWYTSVELWTSLIAIVAFILQGIFGSVILPPDIQAAAVSLLMFILRAIRPPRPLAWTKAHLEQLRMMV